MMNECTVPNLSSQRGAPHRDGAGEATSSAVSTTCEYPENSEQDPNLNDISSVSGSDCRW